jgi:hypothetical protein
MEWPGKTKRRSLVEEDDDDFDVESYFANYVPLSNLPTPPAPKPSIPAAPTLPVDTVNDELLGMALQFLLVLTPLPSKIFTSTNTFPGPATFLTSLLPQTSSLPHPSPHLTSTYLRRANLPRPTLALAACILDSLSGFFLRTWTRELAALPPNTSTPPASPLPGSQPSSFLFFHRSDARTTKPRPKPDLLILAALSIASSFLSDTHGDAQFWANRVAKGGVEAREIDATVRCMLRDMDYGLLGFSPGVVEGMGLLMFGETEAEKNGRVDTVESGREELQRPKLVGLETRATVVREGLLTPELSPPDDGDDAGRETWTDLASVW